LEESGKGSAACLLFHQWQSWLSNASPGDKCSFSPTLIFPVIQPGFATLVKILIQNNLYFVPVKNYLIFKLPRAIGVVRK
jgi:hypothetical protein